MPGYVKPSDYGIDNKILPFLLDSWPGSRLILVLVRGLNSLPPVSRSHPVLIQFPFSEQPLNYVSQMTAFICRVAMSLMEETKIPCLTFFLRRISWRRPFMLENVERVDEYIFQSIIYWRIIFKRPGTGPSLGVVPPISLPIIAITVVTIVS